MLMDPKLEVDVFITTYLENFDSEQSSANKKW